MKSFAISAFFPEVKPAHSAFQECRMSGSDLGVAAVRALHEIRSRAELKGKRITEVRLTIKEIDCAAPPAKAK